MPSKKITELLGSQADSLLNHQCKTVDKSSDVISSLVSNFAILLIITFAIFILNIGLSFWLGSLLGETWYGFFAVGGFYAVLAIVLIIFKKKWLKGPLNDVIVKKMLN